MLREYIIYSAKVDEKSVSAVKFFRLTFNFYAKTRALTTALYLKFDLWGSAVFYSSSSPVQCLESHLRKC